MTLMILSIVLALSLPAFIEGESRLADMDEAQGRLEALFRMARDSAVRTVNPVTVSLDSASGLVWFDSPARPQAQLAQAPTGTGLGGGTPMRVGGTFGGGSTIGGSFGRGGTARPPANGQSLELPAAVRMELFQARALFTFYPNGAVVGDSILLRSASGAVRFITLDPWTAALRVR